MPFVLNGVEVEEVLVNGVSVNSLFVNGVEVLAAWGEWETFDTGRTKDYSNGTNPPSLNGTDINYAESKGYGNTSSWQVKDLRWANPVRYTYDNSYWAPYGGTRTRSRNYSYQVPESTLIRVVPNSTSMYRYTYSHYSYLGSTTTPNWGSWTSKSWNGGFVHATYSAALNHANSHKAAINGDTYDPAYEARSINVTVYQDATLGAYEGRVTWQERRRLGMSTSYNYRVYYTTERWTTSTGSRYTWKLVYDYRTRG